MRYCSLKCFHDFRGSKNCEYSYQQDGPQSVSTGVFFSTKHTFPAQQKVRTYLFLFRCARSRGGLHRKNTVSSCVQKILLLQGLNSAGMNLNRARIKLREKENRVILIFFASGVRGVFGRVRRVCARLGADGYLHLSLCLKTDVRRVGKVADFVWRYSSKEKCALDTPLSREC